MTVRTPVISKNLVRKKQALRKFYDEQCFHQAPRGGI